MTSRVVRFTFQNLLRNLSKPTRWPDAAIIMTTMIVIASFVYLTVGQPLHVVADCSAANWSRLPSDLEIGPGKLAMIPQAARCHFEISGPAVLVSRVVVALGS